jgi:hypothetical protein
VIDAPAVDAEFEGASAVASSLLKLKAEGCVPTRFPTITLTATSDPEVEVPTKQEILVSVVQLVVVQRLSTNATVLVLSPSEPKLSPCTVTEKSWVVGDKAGFGDDEIGASKLNQEEPVLTTAASVSCIATFEMPRPLLDGPKEQVSEVIVDHEVVAHAVLPSCAV